MAGSCEHGNVPSAQQRRGISWLHERLLASQEWLCWFQLVTFMVCIKSGMLLVESQLHNEPKAVIFRKPQRTPWWWEAASTSETSANFYQITRRIIPEGSHLRTRRRENLKSHQLWMCFSSERDMMQSGVEAEHSWVCIAVKVTNPVIMAASGRQFVTSEVTPCWRITSGAIGQRNRVFTKQVTGLLILGRPRYRNCNQGRSEPWPMSVVRNAVSFHCTW
jgi:hypothetical protein